jgi:hypothetical protein
MTEGIVHQVVEDLDEQGIGKDLDTLTRCTGRGCDIGWQHGNCLPYGLPEILPPGFLGTEVLVVPGEVDLLPDRRQEQLLFSQIPENLWILGIYPDKLDISGECRHRVEHIVACHIHKEIQVPVLVVPPHSQLDLVGELGKLPFFVIVFLEIERGALIERLDNNMFRSTSRQHDKRCRISLCLQFLQEIKPGHHRHVVIGDYGIVFFIER